MLVSVVASAPIGILPCCVVWLLNYHDLGHQFIENMISTEVFHRVFCIRAGENVGSCFTMDVGGKQYVCTAKHVLDDWNGKSVELFHKGSWKCLQVNLVGYGSRNTDIAVLAPSVRLTPPNLVLRATTDGIIYGGDAYFLGFPGVVWENVEETAKMEINRFFPLPFVKRATVSTLFRVEDKLALFLDGHSNPGFSGGPVVCEESVRGLDRWRVVAVIAGCKIEQALTTENLETGKIFVHTGIVVAYGINHALDTIQENPIGLDLGSP